MVNNKTEAKAAVTAAISPTVTNTIHKNLLNDEIIDSLVLRKDVIESATPAAGVVTADFTTADMVTITCIQSTAISFSGLANGDVKHIFVIKANNHAITFVGATNSTDYQEFIDVNASSLTYRVSNKNGFITCQALLSTLRIGVSADILTGDVYKIPSCKAVKDYVAAVESNTVTVVTADWTTVTNKVTKTKDGCVSVHLEVEKKAGNFNSIIGDLPVNFVASGSMAVGGVRITSGGTYSTAYFNVFGTGSGVSGRIEIDGTSGQGSFYHLVITYFV